MAEKNISFESVRVVSCGRKKLFTSSVLWTSWNDFFSKNHKFHFTVKVKPTKKSRFPLEKPVDWRDFYSKVMSELIAQTATLERYEDNGNFKIARKGWHWCRV
jgi:hypothetical protein